MTRSSRPSAAKVLRAAGASRPMTTRASDAPRGLSRAAGSHGIVRSVSRLGTPPDNAAVESFFKTPKRAPAKGKGRKTREEAAQDIFKYIELYCSPVRMCSAHDYDFPRGSRAKNHVGILDNSSNLPFPLHLTGPIQSNYLFASRAQARRQLLSVARMRPLLPDIALVKISRLRG